MCLCGGIKGDPVTLGRFGTLMFCSSVCVCVGVRGDWSALRQTVSRGNVPMEFAHRHLAVKDSKCVKANVCSVCVCVSVSMYLWMCRAKTS